MNRSSYGLEGVRVERALHGVDLVAPAGAVTAVVGGDGAGKTTLLRVLAGGTRPDLGVVRRPDSSRIGFVPTGSGFYPDLTVAENLRFSATAYGVRGEDYRRKSTEMLRHVGLDSFTGRLAGDLSGGQKQKLALAMATLHGPELLVLDEPTTGIDPVSRAEIWRIIARFAAGGATIVVATSYLDEAERAQTVLVLHEGSALLAGSPDSLAQATPGRLFDLNEPLEPALAWRVGRRWRQWIPADRLEQAHECEREGNAHPTRIRLADAVMVATLARSTGLIREAAG